MRKLFICGKFRLQQRRITLITYAHILNLTGSFDAADIVADVTGVVEPVAPISYNILVAAAVEPAA